MFKMMCESLGLRNPIDEPSGEADYGDMRLSSLLDGVKGHWPIVIVVSSSLASYGVVAFIHRNALDWSDPHQYWTVSFLAAFFSGLAYAHFFEYGYHRLLMHRGVRGLGFTKKNHLQHHQVFYGENFTSRNREDWQYIASPAFVFPTLLAIHYSVLQGFLSPRTVVAFFAGVLLHYVVFECTHWLTHVEGNAVDRWITRVPVFGQIRGYHIRHHRYHHEIPTADFNFNPPFLGDVVFRTLHVPPANEAPYS